MRVRAALRPLAPDSAGVRRRRVPIAESSVSDGCGARFPCTCGSLRIPRLHPPVSSGADAGTGAADVRRRGPEWSAAARLDSGSLAYRRSRRVCTRIYLTCTCAAGGTRREGCPPRQERTIQRVDRRPRTRIRVGVGSAYPDAMACGIPDAPATASSFPSRILASVCSTTRGARGPDQVCGCGGRSGSASRFPGCAFQLPCPTPNPRS